MCASDTLKKVLYNLLPDRFKSNLQLPCEMESMASIGIDLETLLSSPAATRGESPSCFVEASEEECTDRPRDALIEAQRIVIEKYCIMTLQGLFRTSVSDKPPLLCSEPNSHPIQDPIGAVFLALLVVRKNRPCGANCWMPGARADRINTNYRRDLAALITVCQKMCTSQFVLRLDAFLQHLYQHFLYPFERPSFVTDRRRICAEFCETEVLLLEQPLHSLLTNNPQALAELIIGDLYERGKLSLHNTKVFRGSTFFLLGSCAMNRKQDVLEILSKKFGDQSIAQACVLVLILLMAIRGIPLVGPTVEEHETIVPEPDETLDLIATVILRNCSGRYANQLRIGPYRAEVMSSELPHPVQLLLRPEMLKACVEKLKQRRRTANPVHIT